MCLMRCTKNGQLVIFIFRQALLGWLSHSRTGTLWHFCHVTLQYLCDMLWKIPAASHAAHSS